MVVIKPSAEVEEEMLRVHRPWWGHLFILIPPSAGPVVKLVAPAVVKLVAPAVVKLVAPAEVKLLELPEVKLAAPDLSTGTRGEYLITIIRGIDGMVANPRLGRSINYVFSQFSRKRILLEEDVNMPNGFSGYSVGKSDYPRRSEAVHTQRLRPGSDARASDGFFVLWGMRTVKKGQDAYAYPHYSVQSWRSVTGKAYSRDDEASMLKQSFYDRFCELLGDIRSDVDVDVDYERGYLGYTTRIDSGLEVKTRISGREFLGRSVLEVTVEILGAAGFQVHSRNSLKAKM
ncbi:hypothetical protein QBC46DRAFT_405377 [Diplogelasinospora grovesii]|uniref:Uncharacterized protein n=1 Tax=Diplogelasinospora grovesii TaxID=303347 RepID=A0AAN6ND50_9PEZI|nr:hypothetical protein QBC46DRAFT_405377 [Diplogelasinospora grovesii]